MQLSLRDRFVGCLLGGAVGDALGAPVEFMSRAAILAMFGPRGIADFAPAYGRLGAITDDTQMTLFTAEGLLRAYVRARLRGGVSSASSVVARAYLRWLKTQRLDVPPLEIGEDGWLYGLPELHDRRAPGRTCVDALTHMTSLGAVAGNGSKGCGGVMRMAPVGLFGARYDWEPKTTFTTGCELAALTHGHPTGQLTAGVLAVVVAELCHGRTIDGALDTATAQLIAHPDHRETLDALHYARELAAGPVARPDAVERIGQGWIAEEALAIGIYCALVAEDFEDGVVLAVNHGGDSDSTGAIAGNILGALAGAGAIPARWLADLELREAIEQVAVDLETFPEWRVDEHLAEPDTVVLQRYPGW